MLIDNSLVNAKCFYAPQVGLSNLNKDTFCEQLLTCISSVEDSEIHINAGDFNGHVGKGYDTRNPEGLRIFDLYSATELAVSNTFFLIQKSKQTDHILSS